MARGVVEPAATPAGQLAKVEMSATAMTDWTLEPWTADTFHGFVPHNEDRIPVDEKIGSVLCRPAPARAAAHAGQSEHAKQDQSDG
jgi:hypothetical protein